MILFSAVWRHAIIHVSKPMEGIPPRVSPSINYELWAIRMYHQLQLKHHYGSGCRSWGRLWVCWGEGVYGNSLYIPLNFTVETGLKN